MKMKENKMRFCFWLNAHAVVVAVVSFPSVLAPTGEPFSTFALHYYYTYIQNLPLLPTGVAIQH